MARILSISLVGVYLVAAYYLNRIGAIARMTPIIVLGLACIWYSDALGGMTGFRWSRNINITQTTPGGFVRFLGWLLLLLPIIVLAT
jgi:hypothetical protein